ncbi:MAG: YhbY family RNA-binding protein, partial [Oscillospiraceae bacterium]
MITSKRRAQLRGYANTLEVILQIGKGGVTQTVLKQAEDALKARELIKCKLLDNSLLDIKSVATEIATNLNAEVIQVIGTKFVLYK